MKHNISLDEFQVRKTNNARNFTVTINGIKIKGIVRITQANPRSYRFCWPADYKITKHPDYKEIRRELLVKMIKRSNGLMLPIELVVK